MFGLLSLRKRRSLLFMFYLTYYTSENIKERIKNIFLQNNDSKEEVQATFHEDYRHVQINVGSDYF